MPSLAPFVPVSGGLPAVHVGEEALRASHSGTLVRSVKRCLGCDGTRCTDSRRRSIPWCAGDGTIAISASTSVKPEDAAPVIVEEALRRAGDVALSKYGVRLTDIESVTFTCGACRNHIQRSMIERIARSHRPEATHDIMDEPVAAAVSYAHLAGISDSRVLIYDFGGDTVDSAYVDVALQQSGTITLIAAGGVAWPGGDDVDHMVYDYFLAAIARALDMQIGDLQEAMSIREAEEIRPLSISAKENLSSADEYENALLEKGLGVEKVSVSRTALEDLVVSKRAFSGTDLSSRSESYVCSTVAFVEILRDARVTRLVDPDAIHRVTADTLGN